MGVAGASDSFTSSLLNETPIGFNSGAGMSGAIADRARQITRSKAKRSADVTLALIGLIFLSPVLALIALGVLIDSGTPVLYGQRRVGFDRRRGARRNPRERTFSCWKFRTMVREADNIREHLASLNAAPFPTFKIPSDPRVTPFGRFLRRSSLDELPQLWNVLRGEMSLVGPRPPLPQEVSHYDDVALQRLSVRPGLTCLWQIDRRHRADCTFQQWVERDLDYIRGWSFGADLLLMWRTVFAVLRMQGQ